MEPSKEVSSRPAREMRPDQVKLTKLQAERLSSMSDVKAEELAGRTVVEIAEEFRYRIDPMLLFYRRICGKVVKKDPATGVEYPVPFATVHVEDTDCSFLWYFPPGGPWGWGFPLICRREEIGSVMTDECGNFCVWIPRWDIDWVLRWRHARICFPIIFERPSIRDILDKILPEKLPPERVPFPFPGPGPDPAPYDRVALIRLVEDHLGREVAANLARLGSQTVGGASSAPLTSLLDSPAFGQKMPPPLPKELRMEGAPVKGVVAAPMDIARNTLATTLGIAPELLAKLDFHHHVGPFKRCFDVHFPVWMPIFDVPDITFRVTQDIDGDGTEEVIYTEGFFQVRWNAGNINPVKIEANPWARAGRLCETTPETSIPCGNTPAIVLAGRMPVTDNTVYDAVHGYALRPNRPHPSGAMIEPLPHPNASTPFHSTLSLFGCNNTAPGATHYRLEYKYSSDEGATFTAYAPFFGLSWPLYRLNGGIGQWHYPTPNAQGWYPIALPPGPDWLPQDLLIDWPTTGYADGLYVLKLELGTPAGGATSTSAEVAFHVDNSYPNGPITIEWRKGSSGPYTPLGSLCPVVNRGATPVDIEFRVTLDASAEHLRAAVLYAAGCGSGAPELLSGTTAHWHTGASDNAETLVAYYRLPKERLQGSYAFWAHVSSRTMNPSGWDGGQDLIPAWVYDPDDHWREPYYPFSVIDHD